MKRFTLNTGLIFASWAMLLVFGCHKKKPPVPPDQSPPTLISQIPIQPETPATQPPSAPAPPDEAANKPPEKPPHTPPKHSRHPSTPKKPTGEGEKPAPTEEAKNIPPPKVVIQEGGAKQGASQVSSGAPTDTNSGILATTQQLLDSTENNLRNLKRQLSSDEQSIVDQIHDYVKQSKDAAKDGDNVRAHNLALKARLLSDELVKTQ